MKFLLSIFFFPIVTSLCYGGEVDDVLKKMQSKYSASKNLEYNCTYELYKGHKSSIVHTSYDGYVYKEGNKVYQKINNTEFVYGSDFFLKISHEEKAMVLDKAQKNINLDVNVDGALKECSEKSVEKKDGYYSVKLVIKGSSNIPFSVVYLRIDSKTYFITQIDLFYSDLQDFSTETNKVDQQYPHLKIKFKNTNTKPKSKSNLFALSNFLKLQRDFYVPTGKCLGYELIDNRI